MKIECDIIKDLLPNYADNICSEKTKKFVDEHLAECDECKKYLNVISQKLIENTKDDILRESAIKELDYMKKIRKSIDIRLGVFLGFLILIAAMVILYVKTEIITVYAFLNITFISSFFIFNGNIWKRAVAGNNLKKPEKRKNILNIVCAVLANIYIIAIALVSLQSNWKKPIGPLLDNMLNIGLLIEIGVLVYTIITHIKTGYYNIAAFGAGITGICLALYYKNLLGALSNFEIHKKLVMKSGFLVLNGIWLVILFIFINKIVSKKEKTK